MPIERVGPNCGVIDELPKVATMMRRSCAARAVLSSRAVRKSLQLQHSQIARRRARVRISLGTPTSLERRLLCIHKINRLH
jgi:hypothetical protein